VAIAFGSDTFLMMVEVTPSGWHLTTARVDSGGVGVLVRPPFDVSMSGQVTTDWLGATQRGPDATSRSREEPSAGKPHARIPGGKA